MSLMGILQEAQEGSLPKGRIIEEMKQDKPWKIVKQFGKAGIPKGDAQQYYSDLGKKLEEIGIYLIPVGEIENFCREVGLHGPKFVTKLLSEKSLADSSLEQLREFVTEVHVGRHSKLPELPSQKEWFE